MEFKRGLWKSPELLRLTNPPARGTQKADVYSFGIVLFEIIGRNGPWGVTNLSNESEQSFSLLNLLGQWISFLINRNRRTSKASVYGRRILSTAN